MATGTGPCEFPYIPNGGQAKWSLTRDRDGHRTYRITHKVAVQRDVHGPLAALNCPGLPEPGSIWDFNDTIDDWAYFTQEAEVTQLGLESGNCFFEVTQFATTKPSPDCPTDFRNDPLTFPPRIDIESINYNKEFTFDRFGNPLRNSAWEQYRGPNVEFDAHRLRVTIEMNVADLELDLANIMMNCLNDTTMWGFPARNVKFSAFQAKKQFNTDCEIYWTKRFIFDIATDFDRCLLDEGTKVLRGKWDTNRASSTYGQYIVARNPITGVVLSPDNPANFTRFKDFHDENARVILDGHGRPWDQGHFTSGTSDDNPGRMCYEVYTEDDLFELGVPVSLED